MDEGGFEPWATARMAALTRAAFLLTGNQHEAEDLAQSCLEKVCLAWRRITDNPDGYARTVMHRDHIAQWRRRRFKELVTPSPPEVAGRDLSADVDTRLTLQAALSRLTAAQRSTLVLRYLDDLSESEVAIVLGCSIGTVKSQAHKSIKSLLRAAPELADVFGRRSRSDV